MSSSISSFRHLLAGRITKQFLELQSSCFHRRISFLGNALKSDIKTETNQVVFSFGRRHFSMTNFIDLTGEADDRAQRSIEIASDSEDEDLKMAIAMSLQDQHVQAPAESVEAMTAKPQQTSTGGLAGLDRRAMEAERLARLKRKRGVEEDESSGMVSLSRQVSPPPARKQATSHNVLSSRPANTPSNSSNSSSNPFYFPNHKVLLTSHPSRHTPNGLTAVSMRGIISAPRPGFTLKSVLLSSFIADFDWLLPHFDTRGTSFVIVLHAQSAQHRQLLESDFAGVSNVRLILPQCMGGSGNMHSKVMLLFFKSEQPDTVSEICRIVITSANLTPTDWGVGNVMENVVFVIDVPKKGSNKHSTETQFERKLKQQLRAMEVPDKVIQKLESFDLTATEKVNFVSSVSQSCAVDSPKVIPKHGALQAFLHTTNKGMNAEPTASPGPITTKDQAHVGLLALSEAVSDLGLSVSKSDAAYPPRLDFITSSLGNLSTIFLGQLYAAVCGTLDPEFAITKNSKSKNSLITDEEKALDEMIRDKLRIFFPSDTTVRESKGGPMSAGTICFQQKWWNDNDIIRNCLYDCIGARGDGILMHSKVRDHVLLCFYDFMPHPS